MDILIYEMVMVDVIWFLLGANTYAILFRR